MSTKFWQKIFSVFLLVGMLLSLAQPSAASAKTQPILPNAPQTQNAPEPDEKALAKIEPQVLDGINSSGSSDFIALFVEQADLSAAYEMAWKERGEFVYNTLKETAARSQAQAIAYLSGRGVEYQSYFTGNELYVKAGDLDAVTSLAALESVASIHSPRTYQLDPVEVKNPALDFTWVGELVANNIKPTVIDPAFASPQATTDWGITDTGADAFWTAYGFKGEGILVANIDTGVQWNHPALVDSFKCGSDPTDPDCWSDPSNTCGAGGACDNNGHGTHTMGTMVANDDQALTYIAGMAPNSQWIACKGCETNSCSEASLNSCADWIVAPGGDAANRPNIVNNSWGGGGGSDWYLSKVNAWRAAGIFPAFSSGNPGSTCGAIGSPSDYQESFATANHQSNHVISSSSGRGPSFFGHDPYTKPNISAPGTSICSTVPTNGWSCAYSGTSMASPHTAGAVALLWSCNPSLVGQIDQTFQILQDNAEVPLDGNCGAPPDGEGNYTYGYGYLNVLAAGLLNCGPSGVLQGTVTDAATTLAVDGAEIVASSTPTQTFVATTNAAGFYSMNVAVGTYTVEADAFGYIGQDVPGIVVGEGVTVTQNFALVKSPFSVITVTVVDANTSWPLYAVTSVGGSSYDPIWNDPVTGQFVMTVPDGGIYTLGVDAWTPGYLHQDVVIGPVAGNLNVLVELDVNILTCNAPGYVLNTGGGVSESFNAGTLPAGWTVVNNGSTCPWLFNDPYGDGNQTGGTGPFADADSNACGSGTFMDTELRTPVMDFSANPNVSVEFKYDYWNLSDTADVDISNDGGTTWNNIWRRTVSDRGPMTANIDASTWAGNHNNVMVRWHYYNAYWAWYWQVDDVRVGSISCTPSAGGLAVGNVYDANEGDALTGALVENGSGGSTVAAATEDPAVSDAFYTLFSPAGDHVFTASFDDFGDDTETVAVVANDTVGQDFFLTAGHLLFDPLSMHVTLELNTNTSLPLSIMNNGSNDATFEISEVDRGFVPLLNGARTVIIPAAPAVPPDGTAVATGDGYKPHPELTINIPAAPADGENVLIVCADYQTAGVCEPVVSQLLAYGNLGSVVGFDAQAGTPTLAELLPYDVVIAWGNYDFADPVTLGNNLADYVDAGGKVVNLMFSLVPAAYGDLQGRFITENYTALNGTAITFSTTCLGTFDPTHPIMDGITAVCDYYSASGTTLTPGSTDVADWANGNVFVAVKDNHTVASLNLYPGEAYQYTGQAIDVLHNALAWLTAGGDVPWLSESPITGTIPAATLLGERLVAQTSGEVQANPGLTAASPSPAVLAMPEAPANPAAILWNQPLSTVNQNAFVNQEFPDAAAYSSFLADDFVNTKSWQIGTIFVPANGWNGFTSLMNADALHWAIYGDAAGVPNGNPSGAGSPPVWSLSLPPTDPQVTITNGSGGLPSNTLLNLDAPVNLPAGHYWLVFYPTLNFGSYGQFGRQAADTVNGYVGQGINPGGGFGAYTTWTNWMVWPGSTLPDIAFRLEGSEATNVQVTFDAAEVDQPGEYYAQLRIGSDTPYPATTIPVTMTVTAPASWGKLQGHVAGLGHCDAELYPLDGATVYITSGSGMTWTLETDADGFYQVWMDAANSPVTVNASADAHVPASAIALITAGMTTTHDLALRWLEPCVTTTPTSLSVEVLMGEITNTQMTLANEGAVGTSFELKEKDGGYSPSQVLGPVPQINSNMKTPPNTNTRTTKGILEGNATPPAHLLAAGDILAQWAVSAQSAPWGVAYDAENEYVWINDGWGDFTIYGYQTDGTYTGNSFLAPWGPTYGPADSTFDFANGMAWTLDVGGDDCIHEMDPGSGYTGVTVCGPWSISQRGVAYDAETETFYVGGWNEGIVYHIDMTGALIESWDLGISISGLAYNPEAGLLFIIENTAADTVSIFDVTTGTVVDTFAIPGFGNFSGAGLEIDCDGNLWAINQVDGNAYLIDSGVPASLCASDVLWLSEDPISGTLPADTGVQEVEVTFDASVVPQPGQYFATLKVKSDDPLNGSINVPVTMTVLPTADYGLLTGNITSLGYCDEDPAPIEGAVILIESADGLITYTVETDANGDYSRWLMVADGPYIVSVTADNHEFDLVSGVVIIGQETTVVGFELRLLEACVSVVPPELVVDVALGYNLTVALDLFNNGAVSTDFTLLEALGTPFNTLADEYTVLIVTPDSTGGDISLLLSTLAAFPDLTVTVWDNTAGNPTAADLAPFDVVLFGNDITWESESLDKVVIGNAIADYIDAGGKGIEVEYVQSYDNWGFGGRYMTDGYSPFTPATLDNWVADTLVIEEPTHPVMAGVTALGDNFGQQDPGLASGAVLLGTWSLTGYNAVAANENVVALNMNILHTADWTGDLGQLLYNAITWLAPAAAVDVPWLAEAPITGTIPHDSSLPVEVTFTTFPLTMTAGDVYTASLVIASDDPENAEILVPVTMHVVAPVFGVEVSADQTGSGEPGDVVTYTVMVTNTSNFASDSFTVTLGAYVYATGLGAGEDPVIVVGPLAMGETATFVVTVHIPDDALDGEHDTVQITVTSFGDPNKTAMTNVTTSVYVLVEPLKPVYLPLVWKVYP